MHPRKYKSNVALQCTVAKRIN